ncbi:MAG: transposase [candidate division Zixibacteria bacterium]|nr:transposase [candidate division Zixibacteria bacterium]
MSKLKRYKDFGTLYFITSVTYQRRRFLVEHADLLWSSVNATKDRCPFELIAWVILPDHFHFLLDAGESDISSIIQRVKMSFAASYRRNQGLGQSQS